MSIRRKLFIGASLTAIVILIGTVTFMSQQSLAVIGDNEKSELVQLGHVIEAFLQEQIEAAEALTLSIANNRNVQRLFAERDRDALIEQLLPAYEAVQDRYAQMQFHLPDSTSFLRLHQPSKYGDSLRDFRFTVNEANRTQTVTAGLEEGRGGYGLRVVAPVFYQGQHIGSVEFGGDFGLSFLEQLQENLGGDFFIYQLQASGVAWDEHGAQESGLLAGTIEEDVWPVENERISGLHNGEMQYYTSHDGRSLVLLLPLRDFQGRIIGYLKAVQDRSHILALTSQSRRYGYTLGITAALVMAVLLYIMQGWLLKPLDNLVEAAHILSEGDFAADIASYEVKDEVGQVFTALDTMRGKLVDVITKVSDTSGSLTFSSQELSAATEENAAAVEEVASTTNHFAANVERLNDNAQQMWKEADTIAQQASVGAESIQNAVKSSEDLNERIIKLAAVVNQLGDDSNEIGNVVDVITQIAEQTELLALNAAIEAARAGEYGRGFAVVAGEVRNLAEQSSKAAEEITVLVNKIQNQTKQTVVEMDVGATQAAASTKITQENGQMVTDILRRVEGIIERLRVMSEDIGEIGSSSQQISAITQEQSASIEEVASAAEQLTVMADQLKDLISWFKLT